MPLRLFGLQAYFSQQCLRQAAENRREQQAVLQCPQIPARDRTTAMAEAEERARRKKSQLVSSRLPQLAPSAQLCLQSFS